MRELMVAASLLISMLVIACVAAIGHKRFYEWLDRDE